MTDNGEIWILQCKREKAFGPADVSGAIDLAERGFPEANRYILITTCGLSEESQQRINERPKWL